MPIDHIEKKGATMRSIAIITARGGSKRIPGKNIKDFCGRPIVEYSIEAAQMSGLFDEVMVSTDSEAIAEIAIRAGAKVPFMRSAENADDFATTADVILEVLNTYASRGETYDYAVCIYPTAPFVTAEKLREALRAIKAQDGAMALPIVKFPAPPERGYVFEGASVVRKWPEYMNTRSQDIEPMYFDCGQFYCYNVEKFLAVKGQILEGIVPIVVSEMEVQDIDTLEDWQYAEMKYKMMQKRREGAQ
ncbi:pseudaminic acid cytidylyltransferase [Fusibacter sp. JL298sf-3]